MAKRKYTGTGFAVRLKELRTAQGLRQPQLADRSGLPLKSIQRWEAGRSEPDWRTVIILADALGVTPNDFRAKKPEAPSGRRGPDITRDGTLRD